MEEALSLGSRVADFLNDFEKGLLRPVGGLREPGEDVSAEQFAALSQLDKTLYNFARKAHGLKAPVLAKRLRRQALPLMGYIAEDLFRLDLRTVFPRQDAQVVNALTLALS